MFFALNKVIELVGMQNLICENPQMINILTKYDNLANNWYIDY